MKRQELLGVIDAALTSGQPAYAREAAAALLRFYPGDVGARLALAHAHVAEGNAEAAREALERVTAVDPENGAAHRALGHLYYSAGDTVSAFQAFGAAHVVDGQGLPLMGDVAGWVESARGARKALDAGRWEAARAAAQQALAAEAQGPLASLLYLLSHWGAGEYSLAHPLAEGFHARWPDCLPFRLCLAECLLRAGETARAVELLHASSGLDPAGEVVCRYWGREHPYRSLWPATPEVDLPGPLPADVARALGRNRLTPASVAALAKMYAESAGDAAPAEARPSAPGPAPRPASSRRPAGRKPGRHAQAPETLHNTESAFSIQAELERLARGLPQEADVRRTPAKKSRQPVYVILTSKSRLVRKYGVAGFAELQPLLTELATAAARSTHMTTFVLYVDDARTLQASGLEPAQPDDPWAIKHLLADFDTALRQENLTIGAALIVGGDDVVPFHRLPNPCDDVDDDVPSDNPYAARDENYFIPEWPIGRLPGPLGDDIAPLERALRTAIAAHRAAAASGGAKGLARLLFGWLPPALAGLRRLGLAVPAPRRKVFGYAASVWKAASQAVFAAIGEPEALATCPPLDVSQLPPEGLTPATYSYFNLHGVEEGPEWFGQRLPGDPKEPQFPIALRPLDVANSGRAPAVVYSEACYGANLQHKAQVDEALCLKFLDSGTRTLVGSTKISYGSVGTPLIAADLLGRFFLEQLRQGLPAGEALRRAKLALAGEMHERQGYLDGEDQKTLISFVLYGDPLLTAPGVRPRGLAKKLARGAEPKPDARTLCAKVPEGPVDSVASPESVAAVKQIVARYLPGMENAEWHVAHQHGRCPGGDHLCPNSALGAKAAGPETGNLVFTLAKTVRVADGASPMRHGRALPHFVRVTVNARGDVVKMAVSR